MFNSKKELTSTEVSSMKIGSNIAALRKEKRNNAGGACKCPRRVGSGGLEMGE